MKFDQCLIKEEKVRLLSALGLLPICVNIAGHEGAQLLVSVQGANYLSKFRLAWIDIDFLKSVKSLIQYNQK
jgi:hypothetical protein